MYFLEELCIEVLVHDFERFYFAFTSSKDKYLQRYLEFLQRRYSDELLEELYEADKLKEEYFELLINEHLRFFDGEWLNDTRYKNSMEDIFRRLPNLRVISIRDCGDEVLVNITKFCRKIIRINANGSGISDEGIQYLWETDTGVIPCPELKLLFINGCIVSRNNVMHLIEKIPSLERIDHPYVPLFLNYSYEWHLRKSGKIPSYNLVDLNLLNVKGFVEFNLSRIYTDAVKACLTVCPNLVSLACFVLDEEEFGVFTNCNLRKLHLEFLDEPTNSKINIDNLLKINKWKLTSLKVNFCAMTVSVLGKHCPNLKEFLAESVNFTEEEENHLKPNFESLTHYCFTNIEPSSNKGICMLLSSAPKLDSISLKSCTLSLEMKTQILIWCKNPCAKGICLAGISIPLEMKFLKDIVLNCPFLKEMYLQDNNLSFMEIVTANTMLNNLVETLPYKPKIYVLYTIEE